ncbi:alpha/beta fold hydrolase [Nocardiopsis alba]|uniref:alpha/beta fold hydrolase n=1 Tax=Nocardiopsis alba TaxID=53437 RepID=UPI003BA1529D
MTTNPVGDVTMSYVDLLPEAPGEAVPVLLLHGFGSDFQMNWGSTGWVRDLEAVGRRVIGPDLRGHGASDKPTESAFYLPEHFVSDLVDLLDRLGLERVDVVGYSMGSRLAWELALTAPSGCAGWSSAVSARTTPWPGSRRASLVRATPPSTRSIERSSGSRATTPTPWPPAPSVRRPDPSPPNPVPRVFRSCSRRVRRTPWRRVWRGWPRPSARPSSRCPRGTTSTPSPPGRSAGP